ncbi:MAG: hypothetical protein NUV80_05600 [Candidatus Berkelbacteria bacterium]|nr:hypothetical protein [Candidatus Berkelbacteria bacterium]
MIDIGNLDRVIRDAQSLTESNRSALERALEAAESPLLNTIRAIESNSTLQRMLDDVENHRALIRAAEGPLAELRKAGVFDPSSPWQKEFVRTQELMASFNNRFILPDIGETARLAQEFSQGPMVELLNRCSEQAASFQLEMDAMRTPWLDAQRQLESVGRFAEIQSIGGVLGRMPTFDDQVSNALRLDLGDWRDKITWPKNTLTDLGARSEFYLGLGFDPSLTDLPAPAFQEGLVISGLRHQAPPLVKAYGMPVPKVNEDEEALVRTNIAHDWLLRLESNLRQFIDIQMTLAFGPDWPKHRLPKGMYEKWQEKKQKAELAGRETWPIVAYADFTDYELVICKKDNWRVVFNGYFSRPESVRESFQRLHMIRLDTMHARPIGQDDELLLYVEVKRLIKVVLST